MLEISWEPEGGQPQTIDFDGSIEETYDGSATATEHAVETGAAVTDHVRPNNDTISIEAIITNAPIVVPTYGMDGATGSVQSRNITVNGQSSSINVLAFSQEFDRVKTIDDKLQEIRRDGQVLTVRTTLRTIEDCVFERVRVKRNAEFANALSLSIELKRIRIASSRRVQVPLPLQRRGQNRGNRGSQPGTTQQTAGERSRTLLTRLGAGSLLGV